MAVQQTTIQVRGMTCGSCVRHVAGALRAKDGVTSVDVRLADGVACVMHDPGVASIGELRRAIEEAGYEAA